MLSRPRNPYDVEAPDGLGAPSSLPTPDVRPPMSAPIASPTMAPQGLSRPPILSPTGYTPKPIDPAIAAFVARASRPEASRPEAQAPLTPGNAEDDPDKAARIGLTALGALARLGPQGSKRPAYDAEFWDGRANAREAKAEKARALREADPTSPESKAAQASWAKWLNQAGWQAQDIATLSAEQARGLDLNRLVSERERVRREAGNRQVESALAQAKLGEQRVYDKQVRDEEQANRLAQIEKQNEGKRKPQAQASGGYGAPRAQDTLPFAKETIRLQYERQGKPIPDNVVGELAAIEALPPNKQAPALVAFWSRRGIETGRADTQEQKNEAAQTKQAAESASRNSTLDIVGYHRGPEAPQIREMEAQKLREAAAAQQTLDATLKKLEELDKSITPTERSVGILYDTEKTALAKQLLADAQTQLRVIANLGTPQAAELKLLAQRLPEPSSFRGFTGSAGNLYQGMRESAKTTVDAQLAAYDYRPGQAPQGQPRVSTQGAIGSGSSTPSAPQQLTRIRDPKTGRTGNYEGTPEEAQAEGFEVVK